MTINIKVHLYLGTSMYCYHSPALNWLNNMQNVSAHKSILSGYTCFVETNSVIGIESRMQRSSSYWQIKLGWYMIYFETRQVEQ